MRNWTAALSVAIALIAGVSAAEPAQNACGVLHTPSGADLALALHLQPGPQGWAGTLDSLNQGAQGLPLTSLVVDGDRLAFDAPTVHGRFDGRRTPSGWAGTWTQGAAMPLTFGPPPLAPKIEGADGVWEGTLAAGAAHLRLAMHLSTAVCGTFGWMDSLDQGANGLPLADIRRDGGRLSFAVPVIGGRFEGVLSGETLVGSWGQGGQKLPLALARRPAGAPQAQLVRPQTPHPPYPYDVEEVRFAGGAPGVQLAGTLTLPRGQGPFPAAVLIAGSGPQGRDEVVAGHRIFAVLADHLTRRGIEVLRYDKRGVGASTGDYAAATGDDFAVDATAAVGFLRSRHETDPRRLGLVGHSEGGLIAPMVAAHDDRLDFLVLLAGPAVPGAAILLDQQRLIAQADGMTPDAVARLTARQKRLIDIVQSSTDPAAADAALKAAVAGMAGETGQSPIALDAQVQAFETPWFRSFLAHDPAPNLRRLRLPVLALYGSKDLQVPPAQNLAPMRAALADDPRAQARVLQGLDHLFQPAGTGSPTEYGRIETTFEPGALTIISDWILAQPPLG